MVKHREVAVRNAKICFDIYLKQFSFIKILQHRGAALIKIKISFDVYLKQF